MACAGFGSGHVHEVHDLHGRTETVHGLETYISDPPNGQQPKGIIVFIPDAFALKLVNNLVLSDTFARRTGCRVYLPDLTMANTLPLWMIDSMDFLMGPTSVWNFPMKMYV